MKSKVFCLLLALTVSAATAADTHTVTFRRLNGTVLLQTNAVHGANATAMAPELPAETDFTAQGWDCIDKLACVTNDVTCWALYEATTAKAPSTSIASLSVIDRSIPYSLEEYFQIYDNLAWSDEFSGSSLSVGNGKNWGYDTSQRNNELQQYTQGGNHIVSDGTLKLECRRESSGTKSFTSGSIQSKNKVAFKNGRCEIRAKLTKLKGTWPAFWLMGQSGNWPNCGELDVFEQINGSEWVGANFHLPKSGNKTISTSGMACPEDGTHWGDAFHRIGVIMTEFEIVWYVDDHIFKRIDVRNKTRHPMVDNKYWYILLNLAFGGNWPGPLDPNDSSIADFTSEDFEVDYCRIFTNTTANRTIAREVEPAGTKLTTPVNATVWRGWQMKWAKSGAYKSGLDRTEAAFCKAAMTEYFTRDNADIVMFMTRPAENTGATDLTMPFNIPGVTSLFLSPDQGNSDNEWEGDTREKLQSGVLFNKERFSQTRSAIGTLQLSNEADYTNCCAVVADLVEKDSGAKVTIVSVNVSQTNGIDYATLFTKLNAFKDERAILLFQSMESAYHTPLRNQATASLDPAYQYLGEYKAWPAYQFAYATTNCVFSSAANPSPLSIPKANGQPSGVHTNQALSATVQFESEPEVVIEYGQLDQSAFAKKMTVSFTGYSGTALTDFPVLVRLSTAIDGFSYADFHLADGGDLRFADSNGTLLPHEIDTWNPSGVSTVWVKVPSLTAAATITACYGCDEPPAVAAKDVWDDDYVGVWHLGEHVLPMKESSATSVGFTQSSGSGIGFASQGIVGGSVDFGESGKTRALIAPDHNAFDGFTQCTFEAWTYVDSTYRASGSDVNKGFLSKRINYNSQASYYLHDTGSATKFYISNNGTSSTEMSSAVKPDTDTWTHQAYTFDGTTSSNNVKGWKNGANVGTSSKSVTSVFAGSANLFLGNFSATDARNFPGRIDELRISKVARSAAWIKATHDTVANANFATYAVDGAGQPDPTGTQIDADAYAKCMDIAFTGYSGTTLTDFPVLVKLSTAISGFSYEDFTLPNGGDLRFADASGNLLSHEIDTWNESDVSTIWVKVPSLTAASRIKAYYGCTGTPQTVSSKDVWDDDYVGVWHLGETALPLKESSETTSDFSTSTGSSIVYGAEGAVGGSVNFGGGTSNAVVAADHDALDGFTQFTIEAWTKQSAHKASAGILTKRKGTYNDGLISYYLYDNNGPTTICATKSGSNYKMPLNTALFTPAATGSWQHQVCSVDLTTSTDNVNGYLNGSLSRTVSTNLAGGTIYSGATSLCLGNLHAGAPDNSFNGQIDEVRISKVARSAAWVKATHDTVTMANFATYTIGGSQPVEPDRILYVNVNDGMTDTLNAALVTEYITNIVKTGTGTLIASALPSYTGDFSITGGIFEVGVQDGAGASGVSNTIYVRDGASLKFTGTVANILSGRKLVFEGAPAQGQSGKFLSDGGWVKIGADMSLELRDDATMAVTGTQRMILSGADIDLGGNTLTIVGSGRQASFDGSTFRNAGRVVIGQSTTFMHEGGTMTFVSPASGTGSLTLLKSATLNLKASVSAEGWTLYATNGSATVTSNLSRFPQNSNTFGWNGRIVFGESEKLATYGGGSNVSNTVFNVWGGVSGSGALNVGPGWLNLRAADNTYSGAVTVNGQNLTSGNPILAGGGGIGLWNGAACFPNASSVTFTNTARLAFMDNTACTVPAVNFVALAGETQSISGGVYTARSTIAGITKTGAGTLVVDSPAQVTGLADIQAGTLTIAYRSDPTAQTQEAMLNPLPVFSSLRFADGANLDLSDNLGLVLGNLEGSPVVTNSGMFGVSGTWKLVNPAGRLELLGQNAGGGQAAGVLCFLPGATFDLADEAAFQTAVAAAGPDGLLVAEANWILNPAQEGMEGTVVLPEPVQTLSPGWSMAIGNNANGDYGRGLYLRYAAPPASGYAVWMAEKGMTGNPEDTTSGIENAVRYAFDIGPETTVIGDPPILQVVMDASGNPAVQSRDLAEGRDDVTFEILATEDLGDWSDTALVPMEKSQTDGLWRPAASGTPGYVYPAQMFFKYLIDINSVP